MLDGEGNSNNIFCLIKIQDLYILLLIILKYADSVIQSVQFDLFILLLFVWTTYSDLVAFSFCLLCFHCVITRIRLYKTEMRFDELMILFQWSIFIQPTFEWPFVVL